MIVASLFPLLKKVPLRSELFVLGTRVPFRGFPTNANGCDIRRKCSEFCKIRSIEHFFLLVILISNKSSLGDVQSAMAIVAKSLAEQKQVFDTIQNQTVFGANDLAFRKHDFESGSSAIGIDQTSPELLYRYTTGMEAAFAIAASIGETEFHYSLGDGSNAIGIETSEPETIAEKKLQIGNAIERETLADDLFYVMNNGAESKLTWISAGQIKTYSVPVGGTAADITEGSIATTEEVVRNMVGVF